MFCSDSFLRDWQLYYKSEIITKTLDPTWNSFQIDFRWLGVQLGSKYSFRTFLNDYFSCGCKIRIFWLWRWWEARNYWIVGWDTYWHLTFFPKFSVCYSTPNKKVCLPKCWNFLCKRTQSIKRTLFRWFFYTTKTMETHMRSKTIGDGRSNEKTWYILFFFFLENLLFHRSFFHDFHINQHIFSE